MSLWLSSKLVQKYDHVEVHNFRPFFGIEILVQDNSQLREYCAREKDRNCGKILSGTKRNETFLADASLYHVTHLRCCLAPTVLRGN